jgi:hypothetical protein
MHWQAVAAGKAKDKLNGKAASSLSRQPAAHDDHSEEKLPIDIAEIVNHPFLFPHNLPLFVEANIWLGTPHSLTILSTAKLSKSPTRGKASTQT